MSEYGKQALRADAELWSLAEAIAEGTATAHQRARLETRLRAEESARLFYVAYLDLHACLQWRTRGQVAARSIRRPATRIVGWPARRAAVATLVAALGLLVAVLVLRPRWDEGDAADLLTVPAGSVAVLINNKGTVWENDMVLPTETGSALLPGKLKLRAGVAEVAFHAGGEILLEGPADFDVSAPDRGFLHRGKLTAKLPGGAPALRVGTPGVVVTDRGGECGVLRDDLGFTEVHVFDGEVEADPTDRAGEVWPRKRLAENAGARVEDSHPALTPVPLNELAFAHLRPEIRVTDAAVRGGQFAGRNFGAVPRLVVKNSIPDYTWETYLCFDVSGITGPVESARVRLMPVRIGEPVVNAAAFVPDNLWGETTLTWDTKPLSWPAFAFWTVAEAKPVEFDVTRLVQEALVGDKKLSLRIFAPNYKRGKSDVEYGSRKGKDEARPQLLVTILP